MTDAKFRYTAALLTSPLDIEPRWSAGSNNPHELVARAFTRIRDGEIVVVTDYGEDGRQCVRTRVEADGTQVVL